MKKVTRDQLCTSFSASNPPVLRVQPGETYVMETSDRFANYQGPDSPAEAIETLKNMAGPVYIEGAKPGDTLKIEVLDVALPLDYGWIGATPGRGPMGERIPEFRKTRVQITEKGVVFNGVITPAHASDDGQDRRCAEGRTTGLLGAWRVRRQHGQHPDHRG